MKALFLLRAAAAILVISLCVSIYVDRRSNALNERMQLIGTALERMQYKNDALHTLVTQALLGNDILMAASYDTTLLELNASLAQAQDQLSKESSLLAQEIAGLTTSSLQLRLTEHGAMALMQADAWSEAHALIFGPQYIQALKLHAIDTDTAVDAVRNALTQRSHFFERMRSAVNALLVATLCLLLWASYRYGHAMRQELNTQHHLRQALASANATLELNVQDRTQELETANRKLAAISLTDPLTGLPNRRHLDSTLEREWLRAQREGHSLTICMLDVDWFKDYNDHYGHPAGDACLQKIAQCIQACALRPGDFLARYGGEEFVLLAPNTDISGAKILAQRIVRAVADSHIPHAASPLGQASVSIGIAASPAGFMGDGYTRLLKQADEALYAAKKTGRNRWMSHEQELMPINTPPISSLTAGYR